MLCQSLAVLRGQHSHKGENRAGIYPMREVLVDGVVGWQIRGLKKDAVADARVRGRSA